MNRFKAPKKLKLRQRLILMCICPTIPDRLKWFGVCGFFCLSFWLLPTLIGCVLFTGQIDSLAEHAGSDAEKALLEDSVVDSAYVSIQTKAREALGVSMDGIPAKKIALYVLPFAVLLTIPGLVKAILGKDPLS